MSTASTIADYVRHKRSLGMRFTHGATVLSAFNRFVGKTPTKQIRAAYALKKVWAFSICFFSGIIPIIKYKKK